MTFLKFILWIFIFNLNISYFYGTAEKINSTFYDELKNGLTDIISERFWAKESTKKYDKHIEKTTKRAIRRKVFREAKNHIRNKVYNINKPLLFESLNDKVFIYKVPQWPFYSQPFMQKFAFKVDLSFDFVDQSFYSGGEKQDLSNLIFRQNDLTLKDILLVSKLMKEEIVGWSINNGVVDPNRNKLHYFYILADQPLLFDTSYNRQRVDLNFARHFWDGGLTVGFQLPIIRQENKIDLVSDISDVDRELLRLAHYGPGQICPNDPAVPAGPDFFEKYGTLKNFLIDILDKKGIIFNKKDSYLGLGDLSLFLNFEVEWQQVERFFTGINFVFPTSNKRDTSKLWDVELGNGGFFYVEPFISLLFSENRLFNPHAFLNFSIGLPAKVNRRVPKLVSYDGINPADGAKATGLMLYGNEVFVRGANGIFTDELDANARRFSDTAQKISIMPGPKMLFRLGNVFERLFARRAFFDLYYDFSAKWKDYTRGWLNATEYDQSIITDNSWYLENRIGASYMYQFDEHFRFDFGLLYTFAGKNVEKLLRFNLGLNIEF